MKVWVNLFFILTLFTQLYMASPVSDEKGEDQEGYDDVKDLENLKNENSKTNNSEHNRPADSTSGKSTPSPAADGEVDPQPNSRSAIFRHRGITQAKKSKYWNEKVQQPREGYTKYAGIQYSPTDLAEYVFSTGDEEGVAVAVEELVREGMMGRTDAINYLQDVKQMLAYMREQYEQQRKLQEIKNRALTKLQASAKLSNLPHVNRKLEMSSEKRQPQRPEFGPAPVVTTEHPHQEVIASTAEPKGPTHSATTTAKPKTVSTVAEALKEDDYKRVMLMKEKNSDNNDFSLQVIYKLAKDMFTESMVKDDPVAEDTLSRLVAFMESEVGNKRISPETKQKVLAIISSALVDSLREYQSMIPENQPQSFDEGTFYRHLASQNEPAPSKMDIPEPYRKLTAEG